MQIPKGWKLVPEYPTQEMCEAAKYGIDARLSVFKWCDGYKAMLANAPECADLAAAQEEAARLRAALEEINRTTFDDDANRIAHSALQK